MQLWASKQKQSQGFTIVELLIVVVVIAILAAITIVAYNGIQNRAKQSAVQSAASQSAKKIALWQVDNPNEAPTLSQFNDLVGVTNADKYQYSPGANGVFCATATINNLSYFVSNTQSNPTQGACPGHGVNGVAPITNLLTNTSVELDIASLQNIGNVNDRTLARTAVGDAKSGGYVYRITAGASGGSGGYGSTSGTIQPGRYIGSLWVRSNVAATVNPYFEGSSTRTNITSTGATLSPGVWSRVYRVFDITTAGTVKVGFLGPNIGAGNYIEIDGFMLYEGDVVREFSDGSTANWIWNGTPNASTSTGPPL